ncbi:MAG: hypothetical protein ACRC00_05430, partial [Exiguobacterium acetylicum]
DSQYISRVGRNTQGVKVIRIEEGDRVATVAKLKREETDEMEEDTDIVSEENVVESDAPEEAEE